MLKVTIEDKLMSVLKDSSCSLLHHIEYFRLFLIVKLNIILYTHFPQLLILSHYQVLKMRNLCE